MYRCARSLFRASRCDSGWRVSRHNSSILTSISSCPSTQSRAVSEIPWQHRLFDSLLVFQNYQVDAAIGRLGQSARLIPVRAPEATNYALTIAVSPGEELNLRLIYNASRLDRDTVEAIADDLPAMMAALGASQPTATIADILACMPAERRGKAAAAATRPASCVCRPPPPRQPRTERRSKSSSRSGASCWEDRTSASTTISSTQAVSRSCSCACTASSRALSACACRSSSCWNTRRSARWPRT